MNINPACKTLPPFTITHDAHANSLGRTVISVLGGITDELFNDEMSDTSDGMGANGGRDLLTTSCGEPGGRAGESPEEWLESEAHTELRARGKGSGCGRGTG